MLLLPPPTPPSKRPNGCSHIGGFADYENWSVIAKHLHFCCTVPNIFHYFWCNCYLRHKSLNKTCSILFFFLLLSSLPAIFTIHFISAFRISFGHLLGMRLLFFYNQVYVKGIRRLGEHHLYYIRRRLAGPFLILPVTLLRIQSPTFLNWNVLWCWMHLSIGTQNKTSAYVEGRIFQTPLTGCRSQARFLSSTNCEKNH